MHLVPGSPAHVLLPLGLLVLFYDMFERINNQSNNQSIQPQITETFIIYINRFSLCRPTANSGLGIGPATV